MSGVQTVQVYDSATRFTKNGNPYQITNTGKRIGALAGATYSSFSLFESKDSFAQTAEQAKETLRGLGSNVSDKKIKFLFMIGSIITVATYALLGLGVGAIADLIRNKVSATRADRLSK